MKLELMKERAVAIGFSLFLLVVIVRFLVIPAAVWRDDTLARLASLQAEEVRLAASIQRLHAETASFTIEGMDGVLWTGAQLAEVTARTQSTINDQARANGIVMRSISPIRDVQLPISNAIAFRLEFEAQLDQLTSFLKRVEFDQPVLVVTRANLRRLTRPGEAGAQPVLFVQLDVAAPYLIEERRQ